MASQIFTVIFSLTILYFIFSLVKMLRFYYSYLGSLKNAPPLQKNSQIGDYVFFQGKMAMAPTKVPYGEKVCCYYGMVVKAEFQTKKPKPGKGMQKHRPVILRKDSDDLPFLLSDGDQLVHLAFADNIQLIKNMESRQYKTKHSPEPCLAKAKYQQYLVEESWLKPDAHMVLWGNVIDKNEHCIAIANKEGDSHPVLAFNGTAESVFKAIKRKSFHLLLTVFLMLAVLATVWVLPKPVNHIALLLIYGGVLGACYFIAKTVKKPPFRKNKAK